MSRPITEVKPLILVRNLIGLSLAILNPASGAEVGRSFQHRRAVCIKEGKLFQIMAALCLQPIVGESSKDKNWSNKPKFSPALYPISFSQILRDTGRSFSLGKLRWWGELHSHRGCYTVAKKAGKLKFTDFYICVVLVSRRCTDTNG